MQTKQIIAENTINAQNTNINNAIKPVIKRFRAINSKQMQGNAIN